VFGPVVGVDVEGDNPPGDLMEKTVAEIVRLTREGRSRLLRRKAGWHKC